MANVNVEEVMVAQQQVKAAADLEFRMVDSKVKEEGTTMAEAEHMVSLATAATATFRTRTTTAEEAVVDGMADLVQPHPILQAVEVHHTSGTSLEAE